MERLDVLVRQARDQTGNQQYTSTQGVRQREFVRYANDAQMRLYNKILMERSTLYMRVGYLDVEANEAVYDLATDIFLKHNILKVDYSQNGDARNYSPLTMRSPRQEVSAPGFPDSYFLRHGELILSPIPTQSATNGLRLNYQYTLPTLDIRRAEITSVAIDPTEWDLRETGWGTPNAVKAAAYGAGIHVIGGGGGKIATSVDGETWTEQTSPFGDDINAMVYADGIFVACGMDGAIASSVDGETWTARTSGTNDALYKVKYLGGRFIAIGGLGGAGQNALLTSSDGITWTLATTTFGAGIVTDIAYHNGMYVAVGWAGVVNTSYDAVTWTSRTSTFGVNAIYAATYVDDLDLFVIAGTGARLATSPDGITWTSRTTGFGAYDIKVMAYGEGLLVIAGENSQIFTSPDAITWTARTSQYTDPSTIVTVLEYGDGYFWALGELGEASVSVDGVTWQLVDTKIGETRDHQCIFFGEEFVLIGGSTSLSTTPFPAAYRIQLEAASGTLLTAETVAEFADGYVDYLSIVNSSGDIQANNITFVSYNATTRVISVTSDASLRNMEGYIVFGKNASTHSQLPDEAERYLVEYMAMRIQMRDSNTESINTSTVLRTLEEEILESISSLEEDLLSIAILDSSMLNYDTDL